MSNRNTSSSYPLIIEQGTLDSHYWRDLWRFRELFHVLAWRDVSVRYKQTIIGVLWALIQPLLTMVVFTIVFSKLAKLPTDGVAPYALMVYAGMLPWQLFSSSLSGASASLLSNANLISKVYFPRLIIPVAAAVVSFVDFFNLLCDPFKPHALVSISTKLAYSLPTIFYPHGFSR